tara:strand:+ start:1026 stop:1592 length:567 start_codon:yes stop_codon:yes gene_type:complete
MKRAIKQDKDHIIDILVKSFKGNKSVDFVVGKSEKRRRVLMEYSYENCLENGEVFISESGNSCILTKFSESKANSLKLILMDLKLALMGIGLPKILKVMKRESLINKKQPSSPFLYLWFIGVDPSSQGRGEGTKSLNFVIDTAKKKGLPVCLETSTQQNFAWYEKRGFKVYDKSNDFGFTLFFYKRES